MPPTAFAYPCLGHLLARTLSTCPESQEKLVTVISFPWEPASSPLSASTPAAAWNYTPGHPGPCLFVHDALLPASFSSFHEPALHGEAVPQTVSDYARKQGRLLDQLLHKTSYYSALVPTDIPGK